MIRMVVMIIVVSLIVMIRMVVMIIVISLIVMIRMVVMIIVIIIFFRGHESRQRDHRRHAFINRIQGCQKPLF